MSSPKAAGEMAGEAAAKAGKVGKAAASGFTSGLGQVTKGLKDATGVAAVLEKKLEEKMHIKDLMKFADVAVFGSTAEANEYEHQKELKLKKRWGGLLHPDTQVSAAYDMMQMIMLVYLLATLPYNLAFDIMPKADTFAFYVELAVDVGLGFDMFLCFFRFTTHPRTMQIVTDSAQIRTTYLKGWFWFDFIAIFPFDYAVRVYLTSQQCVGDKCASARNGARSTRMIRLSKLTKFARLSKLAKLSHLRQLGDVLLKFLNNLGVAKLGFEFVLRIGGLLFLLLACTHLLGCFFLYLGRSSVETAGASVGPFNESNGRNWMLSEYGSTEEAMRTDTSYEKYVDAVYWVSTVISSVGYGDITPQSEDERLFSIFCITFGAFLNAYIVGCFTIMISNLDQDKADYDAKMRSVYELFKLLDVPDELKERVGEYFAMKFSSRTLFNADMIAELPTRMRAELTLHRFQTVIEKVPFFHGCREDAVVAICDTLRSHSIMIGDNVITRGEPYRELIIITSGKARSVPASTGDEVSPRSPTMDLAVKDMGAVIEYTAGSFFGELEFLGISIARSVTVRAVRFTEVSTLNPMDIEPILDIHVGLKRRLQRYGVLKQDMERMMESESVDEFVMEQMKQRIEDTFEDSEESELKATFGENDLNENKLCDFEEFVGVLSSLGLPMSDVQARQAFAECDVKRRGEVDFNEFLIWWGENENKMRAAHHDESMADVARDALTRLSTVEVAITQLQRDMREALELVGAAST